ncbi:molybdate ABC transporter substrate-binding protein [Novosphingobium sp. KCTC 2891]|nr:molybdate ABC transporter substrate-binding protein [Novosphingobium sp. KCTC 2891]MCW1383893.1 molybdate ABC transporter substrate-binding protein [Novosphingobium sp. KCTC 2891]
MAQARGPLVLAAASLQEAMTAAAGRWTAKGHEPPVISFAASSALARQIEAGAPADLLVSADTQWMDHVAAAGFVARGSRAPFLTNQLVLIAPAASRLSLAIRPGFPLARALGNGRLAMGDPDAVPAGIYGKEALTRLGAWPHVAGRVARAESVRAALALVARGEAPLGVVYATDARAEPRVRVVGVFPETSHAPILYPLARLTGATSRDAEAFHRFLLSGEGKAIFRRFGFGAR